MIACSVSSVLLAAVLATFLYVGRSSAGLTVYTEMEMQARQSLLQFGLDTRQASNAVWVDANTLRLTGEYGSVTYGYNPTTGRLTRTIGGATKVLASNIKTFAFHAYTIDGSELPLASDPTTIGVATKMVQMRLVLSRAPAGAPKATEAVVSARYVLRNKPVT